MKVHGTQDINHVRRGFRLSYLASLVVFGASSAWPVSAWAEDQATRDQLGLLERAIAGGTDDASHPAVVGIVADGIEAELCTGTLLAQNLVITARHCVSEALSKVLCDTSTFGATFAPKSLYVTTTPSIDSNKRPGDAKAGWYRASKVIVSNTAAVCGNDIALIELQGAGVPGSVATPIVPRLNSQVQVGEPLSAIGFGSLDSAGGSLGRRRIRSDVQVACIGNCSAQLVNNASEWQGDIGPCPGDSGGPALDAQGRLVGIVSRGAQGCLQPIYTSVYAWAAWIQGGAAAAATSGGYRTPEWAGGGQDGEGTGGDGCFDGEGPCTSETPRRPPDACSVNGPGRKSGAEHAGVVAVLGGLLIGFSRRRRQRATSASGSLLGAEKH